MTATALAPANPDAPVVAAVPAALQLAAAVRDHDLDSAHAVLDAPVHELQALAIALAAMVPERAALDEVLTYCTEETQRVFSRDARLWPEEQVREAHARAVSASRARRRPDPWVVRGEREYQRRRQARRRARANADRLALSYRKESTTTDPEVTP